MAQYSVWFWGSLNTECGQAGVWGAPRLVRAGAVPCEERLRNGCLSLGQRWLQGGWRRVTWFPHSNRTTMLILLLCTPFLIKLHTKGCVICQSLILKVLERRGHFMWMEREDISSPSGKGKNTAWGRTGVTVLYLDPWLLKQPHDGKHISILHFLEGWRRSCCHIHCWKPRENTLWQMPVFCFNPERNFIPPYLPTYICFSVSPNNMV